nr:hypothetical protein [Tanacetum cinerariifolium]
MSKGKREKGLLAELFNRDKKSASSKDEGTTNVKAFMEIAEGEPSVGKADARSDVVEELLEEEMLSMEDEEVPLVDGVFEGALGALRDES